MRRAVVRGLRVNWPGRKGKRRRNPRVAAARTGRRVYRRWLVAESRLSRRASEREEKDESVASNWHAGREGTQLNYETATLTACNSRVTATTPPPIDRVHLASIANNMIFPTTPVVFPPASPRSDLSYFPRRAATRQRRMRDDSRAIF